MAKKSEEKNMSFPVAEDKDKAYPPQKPAEKPEVKSEKEKEDKKEPDKQQAEKKEKFLSDKTKAEQEAGRKALETNKAIAERAKAARAKR